MKSLLGVVAAALGYRPELAEADSAARAAAFVQDPGPWLMLEIDG